MSRARVVARSPREPPAAALPPRPRIMYNRRNRMAQSREAGSQQALRVEAHAWLIPAVDGASFALGTLFFYFVSRLRLIFSPLAFVILSVALGIALGLEAAVWFRRGIRAVEVDKDGMSLELGPHRLVEKIAWADIASVRLSGPLGIRRIRIRLRREHPRLASALARILPWPRLRASIASTAFSRESFEKLRDRLARNR